MLHRADNTEFKFTVAIIFFDSNFDGTDTARTMEGGIL